MNGIQLAQTFQFEPPAVHFYLVFFRDDTGVWGGGYTKREAQRNAVDEWASLQQEEPSKDARENWLGGDGGRSDYLSPSGFPRLRVAQNRREQPGEGPLA